MAQGTVDNLNIQLSADADQAVKSLNSLASTLRSINTAFTKDISGMRKFSKEIGTMTSALRGFNNIKVSAPDLSKISKAMQQLGETKTSGAKNTATDVKDIINSLNGLGKINFNESGVTKLTNSLRRLVQVDMSKFNTSAFKQITESVSVLGNMPDVSSGVNRFVSSLSRLANAGEKTGQSANSVLKLGEQTRLAAQKLQSVGKINDDVNLFVQSIGRLASAGTKTAQTASGLGALSKETLKFFKSMQKAPKVSENTIRMTQALAQLASAGGKVGTATNTVTSSFNKLASIGDKTLSAMKKVASGIVSAFKQIGGSSGNLTKAQFSLSNLLKTAVGFRLGYGLLNFGKQAFELGSDITEVENVVDVAFGGMADKAYEFASTAKEQFGISELSALKFSGTLMAMFNSSGIAQEKAAEMSTMLTGLAGDLASFYNISQEDAFTKIRAGMSGMVMPLRQLGIDMTVASLEAYAMSQGITKSWQSMTQGEKQLVRYQYLLSVTSAQQGDFARTSWSWANQTRLLTLNLQSLAAILGQGLISAVLPAVTALNKLFEVLQKASLAVRDFFYVLTGYKGGAQSGVVDDMAGLGDAAEDLGDLGSSGSDAASGLGDAAKAAEELKNATLGIDELNIISPNEPASTGGSGSSGGGGTGGAGGVDLGLGDGTFIPGDEDPEKYVSPWAERIRAAFLAEDWEQLGWEIADGLNAGLRKVYDVISWENVGPKITAFTTAFTDTFNSFAQSFDFDLLGRTIGAGINTVVNTLNQLIDGIDWIALGERFAHGFNGIVDEVDWLKLGRLIGNKFMIAWDTLLGVVTTLKWGEIGRSLADGFNGMLVEIDLGDIGTTIGTIVAGIIEMFREFFANAKWEEVANQIKTGLSNALTAASDDGKNDGIIMSLLGIGAIAGISKIILPLITTILELTTILGEKKLLGAMQSIVGISTGSGGIGGAFAAIKTAISSIFSPIGIAVAAIALIIAGIIDLWNTSESFRDVISGIWSRVSGAVVEAKEKIWDNGLKPLIDSFGEFFDSLYELYESSGLKDVFQYIVEFAANQIGTSFQVAFGLIGDVIDGIAGIIGGIVDALGGLVDFVTGIFTGDWEKAWNGIKDFFGGIWDAMSSQVETVINFIETLIEGIVGFFDTGFQSAAGFVEKAFSGTVDFFSGVWSGITTILSGVGEFFGKVFSDGYRAVRDAFTSIGSWFQDRWDSVKKVFGNVKDFFKSAFQSAYDAVTKVWNGLSGFFKDIANSAIKPIGKLVNGIIDGINWVGKKLGVDKVLNNWDVPQFASGSSGIRKDTFGLVNDQKGATYKELILPPNGKPFIPKGRNVMLPLQKGTKIMPAGQTEELMKLMKIPRFAGGIGDFFGDLWSGIKDFAGDVWSYLSNPGELVKIALDKFIKLGDFFEPWLSIAGGAINKLFDSIVDYVKGLFDKAVPEVNYNPSAGVEQWRQLATKALQMTGQYSESNLNLLLYQMHTESGGNPNAINNWDINAKNGTPSKGLMQVIDPTFRAYAYPGYDKNIYDPLSNILAAIRYTLSRYGSLANGWKGHGYASGIGKINLSDLFGKIPALAGGGTLMPGQLFVANERGPELIGRYGNRTTVMNNDQVVESVSSGVEKAIQRQNDETNALLRQILDYQQRLLAKDTSVNLDGKRTDSLLRRARSNSGYNFRPAGGTV